MREGIGFGGVFLAMVLALVAHDILRLVVARVWVERAVHQLTAQPIVRPAARPMPGVQPVVQRPPEIVGPMVARRGGHTAACINGIIASRKGNGWSDLEPRTRCIATTE